MNDSQWSHDSHVMFFSSAQSPMDIIQRHPEAKREQFLQLFREYRGKSARIPRVSLAFGNSEFEVESLMYMHVLFTIVNFGGNQEHEPDRQ